MARYDYVCSSCKHEMEVEQRIREPALTTCPKCGKESLQRLIADTTFSLRGGGWYSDGYVKKTGSDDSGK